MGLGAALGVWGGYNGSGGYIGGLGVVVMGLGVSGWF